MCVRWWSAPLGSSRSLPRAGPANGNLHSGVASLTLHAAHGGDVLRLGLVVVVSGGSGVVAAAAGVDVAAAVVVAARCRRRGVVRTGSRRHCCVFEFHQQQQRPGCNADTHTHTT